MISDFLIPVLQISRCVCDRSALASFPSHKTVVAVVTCMDGLKDWFGQFAQVVSILRYLYDWSRWQITCHIRLAGLSCGLLGHPSPTIWRL